jgi:hypothetical protein
MKRYPWAWEILDDTTSRAKVIGGWLVHHTICDGSSKPLTRSESMVFLADRDHEWCITPLVIEQKPLTKSVAKDFAVPASK